MYPSYNLDKNKAQFQALDFFIEEYYRKKLEIIDDCYKNSSFGSNRKRFELTETIRQISLNAQKNGTIINFLHVIKVAPNLFIIIITTCPGLAYKYVPERSSPWSEIIWREIKKETVREIFNNISIHSMEPISLVKPFSEINLSFIPRLPLDAFKNLSFLTKLSIKLGHLDERDNCVFEPLSNVRDLKIEARKIFVLPAVLTGLQSLEKLELVAYKELKINSLAFLHCKRPSILHINGPDESHISLAGLEESIIDLYLSSNIKHFYEISYEFSSLQNLHASFCLAKNMQFCKPKLCNVKIYVSKENVTECVDFFSKIEISNFIIEIN